MSYCLTWKYYIRDTNLSNNLRNINVKIITKYDIQTEFSLTPNLGVFYSNFLSLTPIFCRASIEEYSKTPTFSGRQQFYSYFQNLSENSVQT